MQDAVHELKKASGRSAQTLIDFIYSNNPPQNGQHKSTDPQVKSQLKMALLHYHPDKQDMEAHELKCIVLAEEITLLLTYHYSVLKM